MTDAAFLIALGKRIRQIRKEKHISQTDMADCCESNKSHMSRLEAGRANITVSTLKHISECLDTPPADFFHAIERVVSKEI